MDCTFANFVVGSSNQFAHAASLAVANLPTRAYNPLFIYGGVGLGKTHLLQAIRHQIEQRGVYAKYLPAEHFMNEMVRALQHERAIETFRKRYRQVDTLLIDDIQFIAGKERTQEEFFHTFNTLYDTGKQMVMTSDRPPQEIVHLQGRLRSRFAVGLVADIQIPDLETRVAILCRKAEGRGLHLPSDVAMLIASHLHANIRELEGCLTRLAAYASLNAQRIDNKLAEKVLEQLLSEREQILTTPHIQQVVAEYFGLKISELKSKRRHRSITLPRQIAMYLCRELTEATLPEIGRSFGGRDHTTVIHSCTKITALEACDDHVSHTLQQLRQTLEH
jgi:chromosomal replication initiator protein